jgi:serine protease Do
MSTRATDLRRACLAMATSLLLGAAAGEASAAAPRAAPASFAPLVETIMPTVVTVRPAPRPEEATFEAQSVTPEDDGAIDREEPDVVTEEEIIRRVFGRFLETLRARRQGAGVIVDPSGLVITTAHVAILADSLQVMTSDGRAHAASVIGIDPPTDLAVIKIDGRGRRFSHARLGDSGDVRVGDWVLAVGSPYGLETTVTAGVVTATAQPLGSNPFPAFLLSDAAISLGSAGGPLVNMRGEVIAINTALGGESGIGFAIPMTVVKPIYEELVERGQVARGRLGVAIQALTPDLAQALRAPQATGLVIVDVALGGPAEAAGLQRGDVLLEIDGTTLQTPAHFERLFVESRPGHVARVRATRGSRELSLRVTLDAEPDPHDRPAAVARASRVLGFDAWPITPELGVVVVRVEPGSVAARAGLKRGDVIREMNGRSIRRLADFERAARDVKPGDRLLMLVQRGAVARYVALGSGPR